LPLHALKDHSEVLGPSEVGGHVCAGVLDVPKDKPEESEVLPQVALCFKRRDE